LNSLFSSAFYNHRHFFRRMCLILAALALVFTINDFHTAEIVNDYISVPGYLTDVESFTTYRRLRQVTEYKYTVHWLYDGEEYTKRITAIEKPDLDLSTVRINADNTDMTMGNSKDIRISAFGSLAVSILLFIVWLFFYKMDKKRHNISRDEWSSIYYTSLVSSVVMLIGVIYSSVIVFKVEGKTMQSSMTTLLLVSVFAFVLSVIINRVARNKQ